MEEYKNIKTKKVYQKVNYIRSLLTEGYPDFIIKDKFLKKFNCHFTTYYDNFKLAKTSEPPKRLVTQKLRQETKGKENRRLGEKGIDYFTGEKADINHHISYDPVITVSLTVKSHNKLHSLIDEYHKVIVELQKR